MTDLSLTAPETVLVVDDDADVLFVVAETLKAAGVSVHTCRSGEEACGLLEAFPFGAVMADQNMPGMKGLELLERAAERRPHASRILFSGMLMQEVLLRAVNGPGIFRFVSKPWKKEELVGVVRGALQCSRDRVGRERVLS